MDINLTEEIAKAIGIARLKRYGVTSETFTWQRYVSIALNRMTLDEVNELKAMVKTHEDLKGAKVALKDIDTWLAAMTAPEGQKVRKLEHFESILTEYLLRAPGHRLYRRYDEEGDLWLCYYVTKIEYHPERKDAHRTIPAEVTMDYIYERFGSQFEKQATFWVEDVIKRTVAEVLTQAGFYIETNELRTKYIQEVSRYRLLVPMIGRQFLARGLATDEIPSEADEASYRESKDAEHRLMLGSGDTPAKVVVDVFREKYYDARARSSRPDSGSWFWAEAERQMKKRVDEKFVDPTEDIKIDERYSSQTKRGLPPEDLVEDIDVFEVPVHPFLVIFDLQKHLRLSVHVASLTEYAYDRQLSEKLVLPEHIKRLIQMLVEHRSGGFRDIVAGKAGGAIILLTGPPGVGKTLTAEVFSEAQEKPLYSVQASQLGTDPEVLERNLLVCIARANRWGAIFLLDEADVYVHKRGDNLDQNAIVGVFLRVLEYQDKSVMFLTTNRPELVDDAIASRCVARIDYAYPTADEQVQIWSILATVSGIKLDPQVSRAFAEGHSNTSGRDVKNLLKLAKLFSDVKGEKITLESLEYALKFKPTLSIEKESVRHGES